MNLLKFLRSKNDRLSSSNKWMVESITLFIWNEKAYLPFWGKTPPGYLYAYGPFIEVDLSVRNLCDAMQRLREEGMPLVDSPTVKALKKTTPIQKAMGFKNDAEMAKAGVMFCGVEWSSTAINIRFTLHDTDNIFLENSESYILKGLPFNSSLGEVATLIFNEWRSAKFSLVSREDRRRDLLEKVKKIKTREDLAFFIHELHDDFQTHPAEWGNGTLTSYLEALSGWVWDMDGYYKNRNQSVPDQPDWSLIGIILLAGSSYE